MVTKTFKYGLNISAYLPIYLFLIPLAVFKNEKYLLLSTIILSIISTLSIICVKNIKGTKYKDFKVEADRRVTLIEEYAIYVFLIIFLGQKMIWVGSLGLIALVIMILGMVVIGVHQTLFIRNITLLLLGYRCYYVGEAVLLTNISKLEIENRDNELLVSQWSDKVYYARKKDNV